MSTFRSSPAEPSRVRFCYKCGKWPACGYRDPNDLHGDRICEDCEKQEQTPTLLLGNNGSNRHKEN